jgi:hypothetical protein
LVVFLGRLWIVKGNVLGVDIELTPSVSFELGQENNNTMDAKSYGKLPVNLPLGNKQKFTNFDNFEAQLLNKAIALLSSRPSKSLNDQIPKMV